MIETERLIIREFKTSDDLAFNHLASNPEITYYCGYKPHQNISYTRNAILDFMISNEYFAITLKDGTFIGDINFYKDSTKKNPYAYQLGFALDTKYQGNGYMQEALKGFIAFAIKNYKIDIISMMHIVSNKKSENTIKSLGFHYDGIIYRYKLMYDKSVVDCKLYSLNILELERMVSIWKKN